LEEPLPSGGSCLLGSLNLSNFVVKPFTSEAHIDKDALQKAVKIATKALNEVLIQGKYLHPLEEQRDSVDKWRQIGLGTMGMADMLIKLGIKYGSDACTIVLDDIYKTIAYYALEASNELVKDQGAFPNCKPDILEKACFLHNVMKEEDPLFESIKKYGLANSQLLTCAPTGSIATMIQASTGVEPNFALNYTRKTQSLHGKDTYYTVEAGIVQDYRKVTGNIENLPEYFVTSEDILPKDRIKVQSILQKYTDAAISSTINLKNEATKQDVYDIYINAWLEGLKGITLYRAGCAREAVLSTTKQREDVNTIISTSAPKRPKNLDADYYQIKSGGETFIVLVGLYNNRPYEVFAFKPNTNSNVKEHQGTITKKGKMKYSYHSDLIDIPNLEDANFNIEEKATTLYISMLLRHGVDIKYIIKTAKKVNDNITSFSKAICRILSKYVEAEYSGETCPNCGGKIINEGGCKHCESCEYSKCE